MSFVYLLSSPPRLRFLIVVFDFNNSLNDVVPVSPILLPVDEKEYEKSDMLIDVFCVSSFICLHYPD